MAKTVLITGCTPGGIGHALSLEFARHGCRVFSTARQTSTISDLSAQGIETLSLEVTNAHSIAALRDEIHARTNGHLDILVNNAGVNCTVPALDVALEDVERTFATNVFGVIRMCQTFTPLLIHGNGQGGTIVQIGSLAGVMPYVFGAAYNASKAALHSFSDTLRVELAPLGVRVVTIVTGGVKSNIARTHRTLPEGSYYAPLADVYEQRLRHSQANAVPAEEYARRVVRQVLQPAGRGRNVIWEGGKSWLVWFVVTFLPRWVLEAEMTRMFHLKRLRRSFMKKTS